MKHVFLLFLLLPILLPAQHDHAKCGVIDQSTLVDRLRKNRKAYKNGQLTKSKDVKHIPIKFHLVGTDVGSSHIDFSEILDEMCFTNEIFQRSDMNLFMADGVNYVNDDSLYSYVGMYTDTLTGRTERVLDLKEEFGPNHVNIFVTDEAGSEGVAGFNNPFLDFIVVNKMFIGNQSTVFAHELGHFFSVQHPHLGWEAEPHDRHVHGDTVKLVTVGHRNTLVEHMNKGNCEEAGDNICDTPPDYNFGATWHTDCRPFTRKVWDINGDLIETSPRNIMSYFFGCDDEFFSPGQIEAMVLDLAAPEREHLQTDAQPGMGKIEDEVVLLSPEFGQTLDYYNSVFIDWADVDNASAYYLNIKGGGKELLYFADESSILISDLEPRRTYILTIHPFNESGGCGTLYNSLFRTSDAVTSIIDPAFVKHVSFSPNPLISGEEMILDFHSTMAMGASVGIRSMDGRKIETQSKRIVDGRNRLSINTKNLVPGLYMISLDTEKGSIVRKIVVQ